MARRLAERGVRFVQTYHRGWDVHGNLPEVLASQCKEIDQSMYALVQDLKQRGMFDDTLVILAGEFGRTIYCQGKLTQTDYGRDHHPRCFSLWMAGGGIKGGVVHGETDEFSYNITRDPVHVRDFQATILHLFGIDHERFSYQLSGTRCAAHRRGESRGGEGDSGVGEARVWDGTAPARFRRLPKQARDFRDRDSRRSVPAHCARQRPRRVPKPAR